MKQFLLSTFLALIPLLSKAETLLCTSDLTTKEIPLQVEQMHKEVKDFYNDTNFTQQIAGSDFAYTVTTGLTKDIMDDPEEPTFVGKPTLEKLVIYNSSKNQVALTDSSFTEATRAMNLTVGSAEPNSAFRIHVVCVLK